MLCKSNIYRPLTRAQQAKRMERMRYEHPAMKTLERVLRSLKPTSVQLRTLDLKGNFLEVSYGHMASFAGFEAQQSLVELFRRADSELLKLWSAYGWI